ncbi:hypothetical protein Tco_0704750 [Tanacetum coccineum]|uniref:Reverse transcriptase domain-containing protein n=1 Tax=Tanacetum coccineum TaxID=301880 RepID=A0ABQ4Y2Q7_9ASTR
MHTRSQSRNLHNQQHQAPPPVVEQFNLEEPIENPDPLAPMDDTRTMAQLLEAPTAGYEDAIVVPEIAADNFELKHGLLNLVQNKQFFGHDKEDPHAHIRYFNKITSTMKFPNVPKLHQLDTVYNALNSNDQDSLNSAAGGNFLDKMPHDCLRIIESKSKVRNSRNKPVVAKVSSSTSTPGISSDVAELKDMVKALLLDKKNQSPAPTPVKAIEETCVTCGGAYSYQTCPATTGNVYRDNIQEYVSQAAAANYNQGNTGYRAPISNQIRPPGFPPAQNNHNVQNQGNNQNRYNQNRGNFNSIQSSAYQPLVHQGQIFDLRRSFLRTSRALIDVYEGEITLRVGRESITFNLDQTSRYTTNYNHMTANRIDVIDMACEEYSQEVLGFSNVISSGNPTPYYDPIVSTSPPTLNLFGDSDFLLFEEADSFLAIEDDPTSPEVDPTYYDPDGDILLLEAFLNSDPSPPPPNQGNYFPGTQKYLKICEANNENSSVNEPPEVELKDLPPHLEYAFLEGNDKLPIIIAKDLKNEEKAALIEVLKSHKRAIAWKLSDIKGIDPEFCTHKILMEEDYEPTVQHQRRVNLKIHDVIKKEVEKLLDVGLIYPISDSPWVSPVHCVPKKGGMTVVNVGDQVLLFNSGLKIFSGKLKSRWSGPFTIVQVFPYGTVELSQNSGPNFKVNGHRLKHYFGGDIPAMDIPDLQTFPKNN